MIHARPDYQERFAEDPDGHIKENEPVFMARAQDKHFVQVLVHYRGLIVSDNEMDHEQKLQIVKQLDAQIELAREWQADKNNVVKTPDVPPLGTNPEFATGGTLPKKDVLVGGTPTETVMPKLTPETAPIPALK